MMRHRSTTSKRQKEESSAKSSRKQLDKNLKAKLQGLANRLDKSLKPFFARAAYPNENANSTSRLHFRAPNHRLLVCVMDRMGRSGLIGKRCSSEGVLLT